MFHTFKGAKSYLILSLFTALAVSSTDTQAISNTKKAALAISAGLLSAAWVRLKSKGSAKFMHYKWEDDWKDLLKVWNMFTPEYWELVDKYLVGREFSLVDIKYQEEKDGIKRWVKDRAIKSSPFGAMGLFDAYVLIQLAKLIQIAGEITNLPFAFYILEKNKKRHCNC